MLNSTVNRLLKNTAAPLTGAFSTLRSASFSQRCSNPSLELESGSKSTELNTVKKCNLSAEPNTNKNPCLHLHPQSNSEESANVHTEPNNEKDLNIHRECDSSEAPKSDNITLWGSYRLRGGKVQELRNNGMIPGIVSDYDAEKGNNYTYYIALQRKELWGHLTRMGRKDFMSHFYNLALRDCPESDKIEHTVKVYPSKPLCG
eukprot:c12492_g1_i2 orf=138-746(+)